MGLLSRNKYADFSLGLGLAAAGGAATLGGIGLGMASIHNRNTNQTPEEAARAKELGDMISIMKR